jgi:cobalt-precorrin-5B (C1)-methyltransferase
VLGGLSILGTSGIVRPFSTPALRDALKCALSVAVACKITCPVFVPGRIGRKAALKRFELEPEQVLDVGNEWAFVLDEAMKSDFDALLVLGHPGKLAKLPAGSWDTHSSRSSSPVPVVLKLAREILGRTPPESTTAEGVFSDLGEDQRRELADALAGRIREAVFRRVSGRFGVAVALVNMRGDLLGCDGDLSLWRRKTAS